MGRWASVLSPLYGGRFEARIVAVAGPEGAEDVECELDSGERRRLLLGEVQEARLAFRV